MLGLVSPVSSGQPGEGHLCIWLSNTKSVNTPTSRPHVLTTLRDERQAGTAMSRTVVAAAAAPPPFLFLLLFFLRQDLTL